MIYRLPTLINLTRTLPERGVRDTGKDLLSVLVRPTLATSLPRHLQIEIITRCNLACIMCPRTVALEKADSEHQKNEWQQEMPFARFLAIINQMPNLQTLSLHGIGEPLLHPHLFEMVEVAAARGIQVRFTTNATLLNQSKCERLIRTGLYRIIISLDGATAATYEGIRAKANFERVIENILKLSKTRDDLNQKTPTIDIAMVVSRLNYAEGPKLIDLAHHLGADGVILSPMQPPEAKLAEMVCDLENWNQITVEAESRARQMGIKLYVRGGSRPGKARNGKPVKETYKCLQPWLSSVVMMNGEMMPCCNIHDSRFSMGNSFEDDFINLWNGPCYRSFRAELRRKEDTPVPCRWCPDF
jgi:radical SAM protein with 4Fe4S-binding SPASM domain